MRSADTVVIVLMLLLVLLLSLSLSLSLSLFLVHTKQKKSYRADVAHETATTIRFPLSCA